jgi:hypothetical protein
MTEATEVVSYLRLRQICLVAPRLEPVLPEIAAIMGLNVCYRDGNVAKYGLENALLPVDTIPLEVVAPFQPGTAAGRFLDKTAGRGGYLARLPYASLRDTVIAHLTVQPLLCSVALDIRRGRRKCCAPDRR